MNTSMSKEETQQLISKHASVVRFGSPADAVKDEWIAKAEAELNRPFPDSYKWFLKKYVGGEIGGEEIYSLYGMPFESVNGGDIVFQHLANRKAGLMDDTKLVISETDFGEVFFFDCTQYIAGEYGIFLRIPSGEIIFYAKNFYEYLYKRVAVHLSGS